MSTATAATAAPTPALARGSKLWLLDLGELSADAGWFMAGANTSTLSEQNPRSERRRLKLISALIEHPKHGLLLYEVGGAADAPKLWGEQIFEVFPRTRYEDEHRLDRAIAAAGHDIADVRGVIIGHLHFDHAGGLEFFRGRDVPIYVHEEELRHAFWAVATKTDLGPYLGHYLDVGFDWRSFNDPVVELFDGITLHHTPGHTPGLVGLQLELANSGPFYFTSDQFIFRENYEGRAQGWVMRDQVAWHRSREKIRRLVQAHDPHLIFGHDPEVFDLYRGSPAFYD
jgi:glyoxylase-like metal-dependent hydrolase (beta-lactamase superfamily II)